MTPSPRIPVLAALLIAPAALAEPRIDLGALPHEGGPVERVPAETLHAFPAGSFLESVIVAPDGTLYMTEAEGHVVLRLAPGGEPEEFHASEIEPTGLTVDLDGTLVAGGGDGSGGQAVFVFAPDGTLARTVPVPEGRFLNGLAVIEPGVVLVAEADRGVIFRVDLAAGVVSEWLAHEALTRDPERPDLLPAVNGLKLHDGAVLASNTSRMTLLRVPIEDGAAGAPEVIHEDVVLDDFAVARDGTVYGTTHIFDSVVRIEPDGTIATIAAAEDGVRGSTAAIFGRDLPDDERLLVVGDGGLYLEPDDAGPANLVALDVGEPGQALVETFDHVPHPGRIEAAQLALVVCATAPGSGDAREALAPLYTRFLELTLPRIRFAGQAYDEGREAGPTARHYFVRAEAGAAERLLEASPYYTGGVYSECAARPFEGMVDDLEGGVAWPPETSVH